jgi:uncharacterized protein YjbI with pentapeptide repeats
VGPKLSHDQTLVAAMQQIAEWLKKLGMSEYAERFAENGIDFSVLRHLTDQDLKELGVSLGHRRKMLAAVAAGAAPLTSQPTAPLAEPTKQVQAMTALSDQARDLKALRDAVVDAAAVSAGLWLSYMFVLLYFLIAAGGVTHRNLFLEDPVKLPFLNVDLPLIGFFVIGPALFLIVHTYVLLHFTLFAAKTGIFHTELEVQIREDDVRAQLRWQLPNNIFVQILSGTRQVRRGITGRMLQLIAQISLVAAPLALLVLFQIQFLPYHPQPVIALWLRIAVLLDVVVLWILWPSVARGKLTRITWRDFQRAKSGTVFAAVIASLIPILLVFTISTYPGEWLDNQFKEVPVIGTVHELLFSGVPDEVTSRPGSWFSDRLVLTDQSFIDVDKLDKIDVSHSFRGRDLTQAVLNRSDLRKADFTGAIMNGTHFVAARLQNADLGCANNDEYLKCALLKGAKLRGAQLQGADLHLAQLQGADLKGAQLQGANLRGAQLQGADHRPVPDEKRAQQQGPDLGWPPLQGASLAKAYVWRVRGDLESDLTDFYECDPVTIPWTDSGGLLPASSAYCNDVCRRWQSRNVEFEPPDPVVVW